MKVLHVGKFYPPVSGGMERMLQLLCEGEREAADSRVLVANTASVRTAQESLNGVPITRVGTVGKVGAVQVCPSFPLWLARAQKDVVVIHEPNPIALVSYFLVRPRAPLVVWFHSEVVRPRWRYALFYQPFLRFALRRASRIIVSSPSLANQAAALREFRDKCVVIPFGLDAARLEPAPDTAPEAEAVRQRHRGPLILFVGRMVDYKGVDVLLRALVGVEATTLLVGNGPRRAALEELAADLGLSQQAVFLGDVDDRRMSALYQACDLFVLPSVTRAEAFGLVQLEAMAAGKPVVSTSVPTGVPWVNQHGRTGLVVRPGDVPSLRDAIVRLLRDPDLRSRMGRDGRARVATEFTIARMVAQTTAVYEQVLEGVAEPAFDRSPSAGSGRPA
jgi:glycosyltransferase involved in cell wall biosynthesis